MFEIDLMPNEYRAMLVRKLWSKIFVVSLSVMLIISVVAYAGIRYLTNQVQVDIQVLQKQKTISTQQRVELAQLSDKKSALEQQWELLNGLRSGAAAETMLEMIDKSLPGDDVWFINWKFRRAGIVVEQLPDTVNTGYFIVVPKGEAKSSPEAWQVQTHMTIKGQARDHAALSEFVKGLYEQAEVETVRVVKTALRRYSVISVIDFDLTIVINSRVETG